MLALILCAFCYGNFPAEQAPRVTRLAFYELLGHELLLVPLLSRMDRIILGRRFPLKDTSDQAHVATACHNGCQAIVTYGIPLPPVILDKSAKLDTM
jgi:hypothetical protein